MKLQKALGYLATEKTLLSSITSHNFSHLFFKMRLLYSKKSSDSMDSKFWYPSQITPMILATRVWDSFETPMELICTYLVIFLATSMSFTIAHLHNKIKSKHFCIKFSMCTELVNSLFVCMKNDIRHTIWRKKL